jgi:hypothetical protein
MIFSSPISALLFWVFVCFTVIGTAVFIRNVVKRNQSYEDFIPWTLRLLIYGLIYTVLPPIPLAVAAVYWKSKSRERQRFAHASLFMGLNGLIYYGSMAAAFKWV